MASAEELEKAYKAATPGDTAAADTTQAATAETGTPLSQVDRINQMYDAQKQAQLSQLESAYNQSLSAAQEAAGKIPGQYQERGNDLAVQYERNRRNLNEQAAGNGINTGTASQQALALNSVYQRDTGALGRAQAEAEATAQRGIADLTAQYQSSISQAVADNDYKRAAALLDEYNNQYQKDLAQAQTLASYGDFSIYANLYGQEAADNMYKGWVAQNPGLAYNTGRITAEEYKNMTGSYPPGYTPPQTAGTYYYPSNPDTDNGGTEEYGSGIDPRAMSAINTPIYNASSTEELAKYVYQAQKVVDNMTEKQVAAYKNAVDAATLRLTGGAS